MTRERFELLLELLQEFREAAGMDQMLIGCEAADEDIVLTDFEGGDMLSTGRREVDDVWDLVKTEAG